MSVLLHMYVYMYNDIRRFFTVNPCWQIANTFSPASQRNSFGDSLWESRSKNRYIHMYVHAKKTFLPTLVPLCCFFFLPFAVHFFLIYFFLSFMQFLIVHCKQTSICMYVFLWFCYSGVQISVVQKVRSKSSFELTNQKRFRTSKIWRD